jgi:hypothetical protein
MQMEAIDINELIERYSVGDAQSIFERAKLAYEKLAAEFPVNLGYCVAVNYQDKSDRYVGKFSDGSTLKLSNEVAVFLITHLKGGDRGQKAAMYMKLDEEKACVIDVVAVYV